LQQIFFRKQLAEYTLIGFDRTAIGFD